MSDFDAETNTGFLDTSAPRPDPEAGPDGLPPWSPERARVLGALIEKALATPQNYPLSLNALTLACNQTTNRDPLTDLSESAVEQLVAEAKTDGWARLVHPRSGRGVTKYRHVVDEALGLDQGEVAVIGVLLLRGPQTVSELRSRTERLAGFVDNDAVEATLGGLTGRAPHPLVRILDREPGHRERRWIQLLCPAQGEDRGGEGASAAPASPASPPAGSTPTAARPIGEPPDTDVAGLRRELAATRAELAELRAAFEAFRDQFD